MNCIGQYVAKSILSVIKDKDTGKCNYNCVNNIHATCVFEYNFLRSDKISFEIKAQNRLLKLCLQYLE